MAPADTPLHRSLLRRLLELPNLLSLLRVPLAAMLWIFPDQTSWFVGIALVAGLSDMADGWVARHRREALPAPTVPDDGLGAVLDPICDKVFVVSFIAMVWMRSHPPWWTLALLATRDVGVATMTALERTLPSLRHRGVVYKARPLGKATTVIQFVTLVLIQWRHAWSVPLALLCAVVGLAAVIDYANTAHRQLR